jgi:hypothetical protein
MTTRKTIIRRVLIAVIASAGLMLAYLLTRPNFDLAYGIAPLSIGDRTAYLKYHDCGAICSGQMYITQNPQRCAREDASDDYIGPNSDDTLDFAIRDGRIYIAGDGWQIPQKAWLPVSFVPPYGHSADHYQMKFIMFGDHLDQTAPTGTHVDVRPCRVFPDGLFDGTWHEWAR